MKIKRREIFILAIILSLNLPGCIHVSQTVSKAMKFDQLCGISKNDTKSILITNAGDGSRIILSNHTDIETVMNKLYEFDFTSTDKTGMTLGGYGLKIIKDDTINEYVRIQLDGSYAQYGSTIYAVSENEINEFDEMQLEINKFFEIQFDKRWNLMDSSTDVTLEKLTGINYNQVKNIVIMEPKSGNSVEIESSDEKDKIFNFLSSIHVHQDKISQTKPYITDWTANKELTFNISLILDRNDPQMMINFTFVGNKIHLGTNYWYDIVSEGYDINFFKNFSKSF